MSKILFSSGWAIPSEASVVLGKIYRGLRFGIERLRIDRFRAAEAAGKQRIAIEVLLLRARALSVVGIVALATAILDLQFGGSLEDMGGPAYLEDRLRLPDTGALRDFAAALTVAVATVTAILLSISLVVLENAGQRYGGRLIRFLLNERVTAYVLDLLFVTLLFSVWTLGIVLTFEATPIVTLGALSFLVILAFLSLPVYRQHALAMLAPRASTDALVNEIRHMVQRVPLRNERQNRSVANWLRANAEARLADLESLNKALIRDGSLDVESIGHITEGLLGLVGYYLPIGKQVTEESGWFPSRQEPYLKTTGSPIWSSAECMMSSAAGDRHGKLLIVSGWSAG